MDRQASRWLLYGANGYTGRRLARQAVAQGHRPILAGRNAAALGALARQLDCPLRVFELDSAARVAEQLADCRAVMHCAGPFSATALPMMDGCLAAQAHYLDITGEIDVIEAAAARHEAARQAGVVIMPAVGFDVVPTDCLAAQLAARLPGAVKLELAFDGSGSLSPGTAKTMIENLPRGGRARIDGRIEQVPTAWKSQQIPFRARRQWAMTIPWGDLASAYYSTGIPNIEVYLAASPAAIRRAQRMRWLLPLLGRPLVRAMQWWIGRTVRGPSDDEYAASRASLWGRVTAADGSTLEATLEAPGGYPLTVATALAALEAVLAGRVPQGGFYTPSQALGKDFILSIPGTSLECPALAPPA